MIAQPSGSRLWVAFVCAPDQWILKSLLVLTQNGLLLSRNIKDFSRVPELRVEDWTV